MGAFRMLTFMTQQLPKYVHTFIDNRGKRRYRFFRRGHKSIYLQGEPSESRFQQQYEKCLRFMKCDLGLASYAIKIAGLATAHSIDTPTRDERIPESLYIMLSDGLAKVGKTVRPIKRIRSIRASEGKKVAYHGIYPISHSDAYAVENCAHALLAKYRVRGEWFSAPVDLIERAIAISINTNGRAVENEDVSALRVLGFDVRCL